jgi:hypothetical protein
MNVSVGPTFPAKSYSLAAKPRKPQKKNGTHHIYRDISGSAYSKKKQKKRFLSYDETFPKS